MVVSSFEFSSSLCRVGEGVIEGIEGAVGGDRELEAIAYAGVLDRDGESVSARVPEQPDGDSVAVTGGELAGLQCCGAHGSSS
jgi:hypothetical protein